MKHYLLFVVLCSFLRIESSVEKLDCLRVTVRCVLSCVVLVNTCCSPVEKLNSLSFSKEHQSPVIESGRKQYQLLPTSEDDNEIKNVSSFWWWCCRRKKQ